MKPRRLRTEEVCRQRFVAVHTHEVAEPGGKPYPVLTLELADWVSCAAITDDGRFVLVEQYRHGVDDVTLEAPGGIIDDGESPAEAALRELLEETGYEGAEAEDLGWVHPNPALSGNRSHFFLVRGARRVAEPEGDDQERTAPVLLSRDEVRQSLELGRITHALAALCLTRALLRTS